MPLCISIGIIAILLFTACSCIYFFKITTTASQMIWLLSSGKESAFLCVTSEMIRCCCPNGFPWSQSIQTSQVSGDSVVQCSKLSLCFYGPHLWNKLPDHQRFAQTVGSFELQLKTFTADLITLTVSLVIDIVHVLFSCQCFPAPVMHYELLCL